MVLLLIAHTCNRWMITLTHACNTHAIGTEEGVGDAGSLLRLPIGDEGHDCDDANDWLLPAGMGTRVTFGQPTESPSKQGPLHTVVLVVRCERGPRARVCTVGYQHTPLL